MVALSYSAKPFDAYRCVWKGENAIEVARQRELEMVCCLTFSQQLVIQESTFIGQNLPRVRAPQDQQMNVLNMATTFKVRVLKNLNLV